MPGRDVIVVGASAGGVEALAGLVRGLPPDLPAAVLIVCHFPADATSRLPEILRRAGPLPAEHAREGEPLQPGRIYVAPPDRHLLVQPGRARLVRGPRENHHRPAIDPLFRTAARAYGRRVAAVVLSGGLNDGTAGLMAVRAAGGVALVQDPHEAAMASMPQTALDVAGADFVVPMAQMGPLLAELARGPLDEREARTMTDPIERMPETVDRDMTAQENGRRRGAVSVYTCPECGGSLWQVDEPEPMRFRCHVGHAYYGENLLAEQSEALEAALWTAVRIFKERTVLSRQMAARERERGNALSAERFEEQGQVAERYSELIRNTLLTPSERSAPAAESGDGETSPSLEPPAGVP